MSGPTRVVVLGAGGHARVCLDLLLGCDDLDVVGCVGPAEAGSLQRPVLGDDHALPGLYADGVTSAFVAIGDNALRAKLTDQVRALGFSLVPAVSHHATISPTALIDAGAAVMAGAVLNAYAHIGEGAIVNTGATVDHDCQVGAFSHLGPGVHLAGDIVIGEGAFLGVGAAAIPRTKVGDWAVVGAGAVVISDIAAHTTVVGNPARPLPLRNPQKGSHA